MVRKITRWFRDNGIILLGQGVMHIGRVVVRVAEATAPPEKRAKLRQLRGTLESADRYKNDVLRTVKDRSPGTASRVLEFHEKFLQEHGSQEDLGHARELRSRIDATQKESERLKQVVNQAEGDAAKTVSLLREYIAEHPESEQGYACLAAALRKAGDYEQAIAICREEIRRCESKYSPEEIPKKTHAHYRFIGEVLLDKGDAREAIRHFLEILESAKAKPPIDACVTYLRLGDAYQKAGDTVAAKKAWKKAGALDDYGVLKQEVAKRLKTV